MFTRATLTAVFFTVFVKVCSAMDESSDDMVLLHPCLEGEYWNNGTCKTCSSCMTDQEVIEPCTKTKDTVCQCKSETYFDSTSRTCRSCRQCPIGSRAFRACSAFTDTHCSPCPEATFHNLEKNTCQKCQECSDGEAEADACGPTSDRVCVNQSVALSLRSFQYRGSSYKISGVTSGPDQQYQLGSSHSKRDNSEQEHSLIVRLRKKASSVDPVLCLPPAFIIIVLVCYAVLRSYENSVDRRVTLCSCFSTHSVSQPQNNLEAGLIQPNPIQTTTFSQPRIYRQSLPPVHMPYGRSVSTVNEVIPQRGRTGTNSTNRTSVMNSFGVPSNEREVLSGPMIENLPGFIPSRIVNSNV